MPPETITEPLLRFGSSLALSQATSTALIGSGPGEGARSGRSSVTRVGASPQLQGGQGVLVRGRDWEGGRVSVSSAAQAWRAQGASFPPALSLAGVSSALVGVSGVLGASSSNSSSSSSSSAQPTPPSVLVFDTRPVLASFSPYDWLGGPASGGDSAAAAQWLAGGERRVRLSVKAVSGATATAATATAATAQSLRHVVIPVYRLGLPGSSAAAAAAALSVRWATSDGSARSVSARKGAECAQLVGSAARRAAGCGDFIAGAGEVSFAAGVRRMDIVVAVVVGGEGPCSAGQERSFVVELFAPGGERLPGERAEVTIVPC